MFRLLRLAIRVSRAGRGRWVALAWLIVLIVPLAIPSWSPLPQIHSGWFDLYQTMLPREPRSHPVTIVDIDARALGEFGQWPWPRTVLAELIERIGAAGARAVGLALVMSETDLNSPEALIGRLGAEQVDLVQSLARMPSYDSLLASALTRQRVVLGAVGLDNFAPGTSAVLRTWPVAVEGSLPLSVRRYPVALASLPALQQAASGQGMLSADLERGVLRRIALVSSVDTTPVPSFALELIRVASGAPAVVVDARGEGIQAVHVEALRIPTQSSGEVWLHFSRMLPERYVSALDVMLDRANAEWLRDKIVIVAFTGIGMGNHVTTPLGEYVPSADVHAQLIESVFDARSISRPDWMPWAEAGLFGALALLLVWAVPIMRRSVSAFLSAAILGLVFASGFAAFAWLGWLFDAASVMLALLVVFASLFASALVQADHDMRLSEAALRQVRENAARVAGELEAARRIQLGILPTTEASFANERRFELAAAVEPARTVGGDLYDFFMLDPDRLFLHIADVSGKGIAASLFMSITKVLTKSIALRAGRDCEPRSLLTQANIEISRDNPESLFVTAFAAVLDANTGQLRYWNAGHDAPLVWRDKQVEQLDRTESGPPLCVLQDYRYPEQRHTLAPGSTLVMFTDGVFEAEDTQRAQYGKERLVHCLRALPAGTSAAQTLAAIRTDVNEFVAGAPASDDLTLVVLRWLGPSPGAITA